MKPKETISVWQRGADGRLASGHMVQEPVLGYRAVYQTPAGTYDSLDVAKKICRQMDFLPETCITVKLCAYSANGYEIQE